MFLRLYFQKYVIKILNQNSKNWSSYSLLKSQVAFRSARAERCGLSARRPLLFVFADALLFIFLAIVRALARSFSPFLFQYTSKRWSGRTFFKFSIISNYFFGIMIINTKGCKVNNVQPEIYPRKENFMEINISYIQMKQKCHSLIFQQKS